MSVTPYSRIEKRISRFRNKRKLLQLCEQSFIYMTAVLLCFLCLPIIYSAVQNDSVLRWLISIVGWSAGIYFFYHLVATPAIAAFLFRNTPSIDRTALEIGFFFPRLKDRLSNACQLISSKSDNYNDSPDLRKAAFAQIERDSKGIDFASALSSKAVKGRFLLMLVSLSLFCGACFFFPSNYAYAFSAFLDPSFKGQQNVPRFTITPGDINIIRGEDVTIKATCTELENSQLEVVAKYQNYQDSRQMFRRADQFVYDFENITESFSYYIGGAGAKSDQFKVTVIDLPEIQELQVELQFPDYTRLEKQLLDPNIGNITALRGSEAFIRVLPTKHIQTAKLLFGNGESLELSEAGTAFSGSFKVTSDATYSIMLLDSDGNKNKTPVQYQIKVVPDRSPFVKIAFPARDLDLDESMRVPLLIEGNDDYGFSELRIQYEVIPGGRETAAVKGSIKVPFKEREGKLETRYIWDLLNLMLLPEDAVSYFAEITDNDNVSGPKKAKSATYKLRYPSARELYSESTTDHDEAVNDLEEILRRSTEAKNKIAEVLQEMRRDQKLEWEDQQGLKEGMDANKDLSKQLDAVQKNLSDMMNRLDRNDLISVETLKKYHELQDLIKEVASPELKKMMEKLKKTLQNLKPNDIQKALEDYQFSQEDFLKNIEKTVNLLKQLKAEQKLDEALNQLDEMVDRQEQVNEDAAQASDSSDFPILAQKEKKQQATLRDLQKTLDDLQSKMGELDQLQLPGELIKQARQDAGAQQLQKEIQEMQSQLQNQQRRTAMESGEKISSSLQQMQRSLRKAQNQMQRNQKSRVMKALRKGSRNLLQLSRRQESLARQSRQGTQATTQYRDIAKKQQELKAGMNRSLQELMELSQKAFSIPTQITRELGQANSNMQQSIKELEEQRSAQAGRKQQQAMNSINGAVSHLREAMQKINQSGGKKSGGTEGMMQQLSDMAGEQMSINKLSEMLKNGGQLSQEQQAALSRLAGRQRALQQAMEQLAQEMANQRDILGSLSKISQDMDEVAAKMGRKNMDQRLLAKQRRILTRLLDAQRSIQKQDYSKKRRGQQGKRYTAEDPGALPSDLGETKIKLQEDLLRALNEDYSRDYKKLIQDYFDALSNSAGTKVKQDIENEK